MKNIPAPTGTYRPTGKFLGLIIAAFAFLLYAQSISFGYVLDDEATISKNHLVQAGIKGIPTLMVTDYWHGNDLGVKICDVIVDILRQIGSDEALNAIASRGSSRV